MKVNQWLTQQEGALATAKRDATLEQATDVLHRPIEHSLEGFPLVDARKHPVGVVNLSAVLRALRASEGRLFT